MKKEIEILDLQLLLQYIYIAAFVIAIFLIYNEKYKLEGKPYTENKSLEIFVRTVILVVACGYVYVNYKKVEKPYYEEKIVAAVLVVIAAIIVLVISINENFTDISNLEI